MACYPLNVNANDEPSNGNNGTVNGATLTTDRFGKANSAYNFNGSNFIAVYPNQFKNLTFTYTTWVKLDNLPAEGDNNCLISVGGNGGRPSFICNNQLPSLIMALLLMLPLEQEMVEHLNI